MKTVVIKRQVGETSFTAGKLFIGRDYFCDTLEDPCRDANHNGVFDNGETKVYGDTCIPCGTYDVTFESSTLSLAKQAKGGLLPLVHDVPSFTGIRIHQGNSPADTKGCILLGQKSGSDYGRIVNSTVTCLKFFEKMEYAPFKLTIVDEFAQI